MILALVDSDITIEVLRQRNAAIRSRWDALVAQDALFMYSPVTLAEVWQGIREGEQDAVTAAFTAMTCVPIDGGIGRRAGEYMWRFYASHHLDLGDALIAATASVYGVPLWTRNKRHYPMKDIRLF